jgi:RNA-directed DNA polymerase
LRRAGSLPRSGLEKRLILRAPEPFRGQAYIIVLPTQKPEEPKLKALVYLLTHSFSGRALAILRVISNSGARTPGVDGILWDTPEAKSAAFQTRRRHGYRPQPLRRVYIPKSNGKRRALGIPICRSYCTPSQGS